ncbi:hypothetical protein U0C82_08275 [Fulvimarina sp. 2208YS6-2-32]|uniref:Secreted protein n=1 Tax=Fulvimarina uroteuthidis TaxID=3098149 RepID=A0ABU5I178_9HYPH|nr:hypothetical protein [Fulvimarina sp. 2208YS6-2-32]MDY8109140.1 hypothetical protein [Fulvimarina sp. 2208YS6-2-32]
MTLKTSIPRALIAALVLSVSVGEIAVAQGNSGRGGQGQGQGNGGGNGGDQKSCSQTEVREAESRSGGQMMSVSQSTEGGSTVCRITVLVPSQGNGKPRRTVVTVRP